jgi:hypothetical protein
MNLLSRLFGKSAPAAPEPVLHKGCHIFAQPIKEGSIYRVAARVEKEIGGVTKVHSLIRADTHAALDEATEASVNKAKLAIDQLGDGLFG